MLNLVLAEEPFLGIADERIFEIQNCSVLGPTPDATPPAPEVHLDPLDADFTRRLWRRHICLNVTDWSSEAIGRPGPPGSVACAVPWVERPQDRLRTPCAPLT